MRQFHKVASLALAGLLAVASAADGAVSIGRFAGGVAEPGWGRFNSSTGVGGLDATVYTVTDLDTSGDGGAIETNVPGFSDTIGYSFTAAGPASEAAFFANDFLVFDMIYRGTPTDPSQGGFSQVFQVIFQSNNNNFALQSFQSNSSGVALSSFDAGGTSAGFGPGAPASPATRLNVTIDYRSFKNSLPAGFDPSTLQFWISTNDSNRPFKAMDNVRLDAVPEPASLAALGAAGAGLLVRRRRRA